MAYGSAKINLIKICWSRVMEEFCVQRQLARLVICGILRLVLGILIRQFDCHQVFRLYQLLLMELLKLKKAGSDSPTEQGREILEETSASPSPSPSPQQPSEQPDPVPEQSSAMPSLPQTEPSSQLAGDDAGTVDKRPLEEGETSPRMKKRTSKIHFDMKTNTHKVVYTDVEEPAKKAKPLPLNIARSDAGGVKHAGEAASSGRPEKSSRTGEGLSSSPTFAGNINQVKTCTLELICGLTMKNLLKQGLKKTSKRVFR